MDSLSGSKISIFPYGTLVGSVANPDRINSGLAGLSWISVGLAR